jgi:hypothetical protein
MSELRLSYRVEVFVSKKATKPKKTNRKSTNQKSNNQQNRGDEGGGPTPESPESQYHFIL